MATRLLCAGVIRQLRCAHLSGYGAKKLCQLERIAVAQQNVQWLHVKVYDKDAGWDERRANTSKLEESSQFVEEPSVAASQLPLKRVSVENYNQEVATSENKDDGDTFGYTPSAEELERDEGDIAEEEFLQNPPSRAKRLRLIDYARQIKDHLNANRLKEALEVLEKRMKEDRVKPDTYIYNLLISGCAKAGYTKKAFNLFAQMRKRGLKPKGGTYTSLFNACANAPYASHALERANYLRETMLEKGYEPNVKNYNAMIKAYGRSGDVKTAYLLADEMMDREMEVNADTFNFLLQACASDKEFGFRHCLLTWHKMLQRGIRPDYYTFNGVLRCVRDCGFGDLHSMEEALTKILNNEFVKPLVGSREIENPKMLQNEKDSSKENPFSDKNRNQEQATVEISNTSSSTSSLQVNNEITQLEIPNLLAPRPHLGSLISLTEVREPHERFLLLGGLNGFLDLMKQNNVTPDIQTFTTILQVVPPTNAAEKQIISLIRRIGLKADIDFFNILIKKRSMRFDYEGGKEVLSMIRTAGLKPDIVTYGVLALGCQTVEAASELLQQMHQNGVRMNIQILGAMLRQGCAQKAFPYITEIMQISLDEHIKPNDIFLTHLNNFYNRCARAIDARHPSTKTKHFKKEHKKFCDKLRLYYEELGIAGLKLEDAIRKIKEHHYQQYKEDLIDGMEPVKNEKLARKQKVRKYIKKIKVENLRDDPEQNSLGEKQKRLPPSLE